MVDWALRSRKSPAGASRLRRFFSSMFSKPTVGVVTKRDLATSEQLDKAQKYLRLAGVKQTFIISNVTGEGIAELIQYLGLEL